MASCALFRIWQGGVQTHISHLHIVWCGPCCPEAALVAPLLCVLAMGQPISLQQIWRNGWRLQGSQVLMTQLPERPPHTVVRAAGNAANCQNRLLGGCAASPHACARSMRAPSARISAGAQRPVLPILAAPPPRDAGSAAAPLAPAFTLATRRILSMELMRKQPSILSSLSRGRRSSAETASCVSAVAPHRLSRKGRAASPAHSQRAKKTTVSQRRDQLHAWKSGFPLSCARRSCPQRAAPSMEALLICGVNAQGGSPGWLTTRSQMPSTSARTPSLSRWLWLARLMAGCWLYTCAPPIDTAQEMVLALALQAAVPS